MSASRRFVILMHDHPVLHWDLMFEVGDVLRTWRLERAPQLEVEIAAVALKDHRRKYLDYEGPVGGNRGTVRRWDTGSYTNWTEGRNDVAAVVRGNRISGTVSLMRSGERDCWRFTLKGADV